jgi:hypothetical protein
MNIHADVIKLFVTVGLSEQKALETIKNDVLTKRLKFAIEEVMCVFFNEVCSMPSVVDIAGRK